MIIWYFLFSLLLVDMLLCAIYSRLRKKLDSKRENHISKIDLAFIEKKYSIKVIASKIDRMLYGMCRFTSVFLGYIPSHTLRRLAYKYIFCMKINKHAIIHGGCEIRSPWNISIGNSVIGVGAILDGRNGIEIDDDVVLATGVWIWTEQHDAEDPYFRVLDKGGKVTIKRHVWVGNRVVIIPKVTVNEGAVIAAGAVVTKDCDTFTMYGGVPAKEIHKRNSDLRYTNVTKGIWPFY